MKLCTQRNSKIVVRSLLLLNVLQVVLFVTNVYGDISNFNALISSILISRFMLNLRHIDHSTDHDLYSQHSSSMQSQHIRTIQSWMSDVRFTHTLVGNMGEPLTHGSFTMSTALTYASEAENPGILEVSRASKASVPDIMTLGEEIELRAL
ncbi:hypothetical protein AcW1_002632 [Taiwanofungus camphoratus]|nr:hypothetical protein AcW1_002632 [Antrodia cinnamomea]